MEWISVADRLPDDGSVDYVVICNGEPVVARYWATIGKWISGDVRAQQGEEVTHWAAITPPPTQTRGRVIVEEFIKIIEQHLNQCPRPVINAYFTHLKKHRKISGYCDCDGEKDPTCVWDDDYEGPVSDCVFGSQGITKDTCPHWNNI